MMLIKVPQQVKKRGRLKTKFGTVFVFIDFGDFYIL